MPEAPLTVSQLYIYPIKSLAGIAVPRARITDRGFAHDRRYMLVTPDLRFITIRRYPQMTLLRPEIADNTLQITHANHPGDPLYLPLVPGNGTAKRVMIWNDTVGAQHVSEEADNWFSRMLGIDCQLVYMPDESRRPVAPSSGLRPAGKITSFADAYPFLMIGELSLEDLNDRYPGDERLAMARFRPNIVVSGGYPYIEDALSDFSINGVAFTALEKCARCGVPNVDPVTARVSDDGEPLATLAGYRREGGKIYFGVNLVHRGVGEIRVGQGVKGLGT